MNSYSPFSPPKHALNDENAQLYWSSKAQTPVHRQSIASRLHPSSGLNLVEKGCTATLKFLAMENLVL